MQPPPRKRSWIRRHPFLSILALPALFVLCVNAAWIPHDITMLTQGARIAAATTPLDLAKAATVNGHDLTFDGDDHMTGFIQVSETLGLEGFNSGYQNSVMEDCYYVQRAFWHRYPKLEEVYMLVYGPMVNRETKQDAGTGAMGHCYLQSANAQNMPWDELDYRHAWSAYNDARFSLAVQQ